MRIDPRPLVPALALLVPATAAEPARAALVCRIQGKAVLHAPGKGVREAALYDWLPVGGRVETGPGARLVLVFGDGTRCALEENGRARIGAKGLQAAKGRVTAMDPLPMIPTMAHTTVATATGKPGGITVRRPVGITGFRPRNGGALLADAAVLSWTPPPGLRCRVQVADAAGRAVHEAITGTGRLDLPAGLLRPGGEYVWRIEPAEGGPGPSLEARFRTVPAERAAIRAQVQAAAAAGDADAAALLVAMDRWLGLEPGKDLRP